MKDMSIDKDRRVRMVVDSIDRLTSAVNNLANGVAFAVMISAWFIVKYWGTL